MERLVKVFQDFWPEVTAIIIASLVSIFYKNLRTRANNIICTLQKKWWGGPKKCQFETGIIGTLEKIQAELHPNGGSSLRDAINKIDIKVTKVGNKLSTIQASTEIITDTLNICRWAADKEGNIVYINRPLKKLIGACDDEGCLGASWVSNVIYIEDRDTSSAEWIRVVDSKSEFHHTYRITNIMTGEIIKVTSHARIIINEQGEVNGWTGVLIPHTGIEPARVLHNIQK